MSTIQDRPFPVEGIHHLALVCSDMARTVEFYSEVLGFPLIKTVELPAGMGQHFFFDIGGGNSLAFFWLPNGPGPAPGVAAPRGRPDHGELESAVGSMNHVALTVPFEHLETYRERLLARGIDCSPIVHHDDSKATVCDEVHPGVFLSSVYFQDPDGILLEFAAWTRRFTAGDVRHTPAGAVPAGAGHTTTTTREQ